MANTFVHHIRLVISFREAHGDIYSCHCHNHYMNFDFKMLIPNNQKDYHEVNKNKNFVFDPNTLETKLQSVHKHMQSITDEDMCDLNLMYITANKERKLGHQSMQIKGSEVKAKFEKFCQKLSKIFKLDKHDWGFNQTHQSPAQIQSIRIGRAPAN